MPKAARATWAEHAVPELSKAGFAYDILRRRILDNTYRPGDRLRLSELAHDLNLSEMPVREALRLLQKDGLVIMRLHRGAEVARLSFQRGLDVIEARMTLERAVARAAMPHHNAASLAGLERLLIDMERTANRPVKFALKNREFCGALFAPGPNEFMRQLVEDLWDQVWQASSTSVFDVMRHRVQETIEENRAILDILRSRNAGRLGSAMDRRMRNTIAAWKGAIERTRGASAHEPRASRRKAKA